MAEVNLHTDATQVLHRSIIQQHILRTDGIHEPGCKEQHIRQDKCPLDVHDKSHHSKCKTRNQSYHPMFLHPVLDTIPIEINHTASNKEWRTIDDVDLINWFHHEVRSTEIGNRNRAEHQRQQQYHPPSLLIIKQEREKRKQHVESKDRTQEPTNTYHLDIRIRQEVETHRNISKTLAERAPRRFHHKANRHHHGEERPRAVIPLGIKLDWRNRPRFHTFIIATTHAECTDNHEEQGEVGEPRYHLTRQNVRTRLDSHICLYVHQHNA